MTASRWALRRAGRACPVATTTGVDLASLDAEVAALVRRRVELTGSGERAEAVLARVSAALAAPAARARPRPRQTGAVERAAEEAVTETVALSAASARVSRGFEDVVQVVSEMRTCIDELARGTASTAAVAGASVQLADAAGARVSELGQAGDQIGETIRLITSITARSRTLALNATIEAARAGSAGRGFAVVAGEVKALAEQTAEAAQQIADRIAAVQSGTKQATSVIEELRTSITEVHGLQETMVAAVEEQGAQAATIVSSCTEASRSSAAIAASVVRLTEVQRRAFVTAALTTARSHVERAGPVVLGGDQVTWQVTDPVTGARRAVVLPELVVGATRLGAVTDPRQPAPLVDDVVRDVGGLCTVFQRTSEGDLLRVATTVVTTDGRRAVGTVLARRDADGAPNAVVAAVLRDETFYGEAVVVGRPCATAYAPLHDSAGDVVGALFVGIPRDV